MQSISDTIYATIGADSSLAPALDLGARVGIILLAATLVYLLATRFLLPFIESLLSKTENAIADVLVRQHIFRRLLHIFPALVIYELSAHLLAQWPASADALRIASQLYLVLMVTLFLDAVINAGLEIYRRYDISKHIPIKSFTQVLKLILYFLATVVCISILLGRSPVQLIAGLGAMTAVLMLVFRDPILGLVAGLQLTSNRMVARGDWIEMPKYGVDGDVLDIALTTVKVRNFDNTVTTVPTQALINDSFKNWQAMQVSGGRRIKRAINIDLSSIRFCDDELLQRFAQIDLLKDYLTFKGEQLKEANGDLTTGINSRRLTNIGTFRAYIEAYLRNHPEINTHLTFLIRQLKPTSAGLPLEIYVFSREKRWVHYEGIQSDIFDHILAVVPEFDLRVFQEPSGLDFRRGLNPITTTD